MWWHLHCRTHFDIHEIFSVDFIPLKIGWNRTHFRIYHSIQSKSSFRYILSRWREEYFYKIEIWKQNGLKCISYENSKFSPLLLEAQLKNVTLFSISGRHIWLEISTFWPWSIWFAHWHGSEQWFSGIRMETSWTFWSITGFKTVNRNKIYN